MKNLLILGAGTAGTMVANKMRRLLDNDEWRITIVDQHETHYYQPGFPVHPVWNVQQKTMLSNRSAISSLRVSI